MFAYCSYDNDAMLTSANRVRRLIGPNGACPNVTRLSGIYCILISQIDIVIFSTSLLVSVSLLLVSGNFKEALKKKKLSKF